MNIIHIALPKTATTTLQQLVFPFICKKKIEEKFLFYLLFF